MAISNYTELQAAIENWLDRSDLSARVPEFIALAEAQMNRALRIRIMEGRYTASTVKAQRIYALPTDYRQMRSLRINLDPIVALVYLTPQNMNQVWAGSSTGTPKAYTIVGNDIRLGPAPDSVMEMEINYYRAVPALSGTNTTTTMLTQNPDIYLYGALMAAEPFLMNDERLVLWGGLFDKAVRALQDQDARDRASGSELTIRNLGLQ
tara:strand:- start:818 stop:1441 length:624 start_codon:yes stop_codon:yes gene_type:complete